MTTPTERADLIARLRATRIHNTYDYADQVDNLKNVTEAADMLAADAPFNPDWVTYRQGLEDGKADAQQVAVPEHIQYRWNIDRDGEDLLICENNHEKGVKCDYVRYVRADSVAAPQPPQPEARKPMTKAEVDAIWNTPLAIGVGRSRYDIVRALEAHHGTIEIDKFRAEHDALKADAERYRSMGGKPKPD